MPYKRRTGKFQTEYVWRKASENKPTLSKAIHVIGTHRINQLTRDELLKYGGEIVKEARTRMSLLARAGLKTSPAYRYIKEKDITFGLSRKSDADIKATILEAYKFLHTKTSVVSNAYDYSQWLDEHLGKTTEEQREKIWDVVHRFEKDRPGQFINFNYDETIRKIAEVTISEDFDVDKATDRLYQLLEEMGSFKGVNIEFSDKQKYFPGNR